MYLSKTLIHKRKHELETVCKESIWVSVKTNHDNILIALFYSKKTADNIF